MQSGVPSRSGSFGFNMHGAGGQRALLHIRSASSNSKRHQRPPRRRPPCNNEMKCTMKGGNERWLREQIELGSARHSYSSLSAAALKAQQQEFFFFFVFGRVRRVHSERLPSPSRHFLVVLPNSRCFTPCLGLALDLAGYAVTFRILIPGWWRDTWEIYL